VARSCEGLFRASGGASFGGVGSLLSITVRMDQITRTRSARGLLRALRSISSQVACQSQVGIFAIHSSAAVRRCAASAIR
jgi:hypothetical protein